VGQKKQARIPRTLRKGGADPKFTESGSSEGLRIEKCIKGIPHLRSVQRLEKKKGKRGRGGVKDSGKYGQKKELQ